METDILYIIKEIAKQGSNKGQLELTLDDDLELIVNIEFHKRRWMNDKRGSN